MLYSWPITIKTIIAIITSIRNGPHLFFPQKIIETVKLHRDLRGKGCITDTNHRLEDVTDGRVGRLDQWEFQDPKMEVLYHIRQYFAGIFPEI